MHGNDKSEQRRKNGRCSGSRSPNLCVGSIFLERHDVLKRADRPIFFWTSLYVESHVSIVKSGADEAANQGTTIRTGVSYGLLFSTLQVMIINKEMQTLLLVLSKALICLSFKFHDSPINFGMFYSVGVQMYGAAQG